MWLQYISMGERDFFDSEIILTVHIYDENLKIPIVGPKIKVVESIWCDLSKLVREGQKVNCLPVSRKSPKTSRKRSFPRMWYIWEVFGAFPQKYH